MLDGIDFVKDQIEHLKEWHAEMLGRLSVLDKEIQAMESERTRDEAQYGELLGPATELLWSSQHGRRGPVLYSYWCAAWGRCRWLAAWQVCLMSPGSVP